MIKTFGNLSQDALNASKHVRLVHVALQYEPPIPTVSLFNYRWNHAL